VHGPDAERALIGRLPTTPGVENGRVEGYLAAFEVHDAGLELLEVGVLQEELTHLLTGLLPISRLISTSCPTFTRNPT
jgi:hypothetical protein